MNTIQTYRPGKSYRTRCVAPQGMSLVIAATCFPGERVRVLDSQSKVVFKR